MYKILSFILFPVFVFAQEVAFQLEKSDLFEDDYKETEIVLAEKYDGNNFIILRSFKSGATTKSGFYLEKYNKSLKKISDFEFNIEHPHYEKYSVVLGAFYSASKIYIFEMFYDLKGKNYVCQANIIDENYKVVKKELFHLSKDEAKGFGLQSLYYNADLINLNNLGLFEQKNESSKNEVFSNPFDRKSSFDLDNKSSSELVLKVNKGKTLFSIAMTFEYGNESLMKLFLFDTNLNKKIEKDFVSEEGKVINKNIELHDSLEEIYLTQKVYSDDLKNKKEGGKYFYEIKKITPNDLQTQKIEVENHYLPFLNVFYHDNDLYGIGFYSDVKDRKYSGVSYFKINSENLELKSAKYNLFNEQFILDKYGKLKEKEFKHIVVKNVFWNDGEMFINAEEVYVVSGNNNSPTIYNYDDIISINLNSKGEVIYARNINKRQGSKLKEDPYISYTSLLFKNKNYFFINTREKIGELSNDRIEFEGTRKNNSYLNVISVNKNGDFNFKEIVNKEDTEVPFMVSKGLVIDNSVIFLGQKGKNKQLLKVTL